jgi:hypothetical protein
VEYVIGISPNAVLNRESQWVKDNVVGVWQQTFCTARRFHTFGYKAGKWREHRRVICRAQCSAMGKDLRYIVTSFNGASSKYVYEKLYCGLCVDLSVNWGAVRPPGLTPFLSQP